MTSEPTVETTSDEPTPAPVASGPDEQAQSAQEDHDTELPRWKRWLKRG